MGNHFRENKLTMLFDALISPILFYASEVFGSNGRLEISSIIPEVAGGSC